MSMQHPLKTFYKLKSVTFSKNYNEVEGNLTSLSVK